METIIILVFLFIFWYTLREKINFTNRSVDELREELRKYNQADQKEKEGISVTSDEPLQTPAETYIPTPITYEPPSYSEIFEADGEIPEPIITPRPKKKVNYEKYIGENLFGKIGILILVAGIGFFVKYAIDNDWINEVMRTALGFACGLVLLFLSWRLKKEYRAFSSLLAGGAFAVFYVTVAVAFHFYQLFSQPLAFAILVLITVGMAVLATLNNHRELAIIALLGGFIAPFLVSTGEGNYMVLFTYILILNAGMFALSLAKKWAELPVISFLATTVVMILYLYQSYGFQSLFNVSDASVPTHLLVFSTLFYFIFLLPLLIILKTETPRVNRILLLLIAINNFAYLGFGLFFIRLMALSFNAYGILSLFIAVVNGVLLFWLKKEKQNYSLLIHTMLGLILVFVTITIPLQLNGNTITLMWASEMLILLWLYVKTRIRLYEYFSLGLIILTAFSFFFDIPEYIIMTNPPSSFLVTHLFTGMSFAVVALLMARYRDEFDSGRILRYRPWNNLMVTLSVLIIYYVFAREIDQRVTGSETWIKAQLLFIISYLLLLVILLRKRYPIALGRGFYKTVLLINLLAFLIDSYIVTTWWTYQKTDHSILTWLITLVTIATFVEIGRQYYSAITSRVMQSGFTVYFITLATFCLLGLENLILYQAGVQNEGSAGLSVALSVAGFTQMALGMRLHIKVLRKLSLVTLGIVLAKLILIDLWAMPTVGKIIVFISLGIILLVLSFLYQKLKTVLFGEDEEEHHRVTQSSTEE